MKNASSTDYPISSQNNRRKSISCVINGIEKEQTDLLIVKPNHVKSNLVNGYKLSPPSTLKLPNGNSEGFLSQSLPDCSDDNDSKPDFNGFKAESGESPELWFRTWPDCCDNKKIEQNTQCDSNNRSNGPMTLNEALQNISLAYSPITKQLHLVNEPTSLKLASKVEDKKLGHKRNVTGSFSSTVSTVSSLSGLSDVVSPSGSLLDTEDRSLTSLDDYSVEKNRKNGLSNFFARNVFPWKSDKESHSQSNSSIWKLFSGAKSTNRSNSPIHVVASSSALIQHERPSNLPAKTQEEEQRHREEYKAILAAAKKRDAQNNAAKQRMQKLQLQQEEQQVLATRHFQQKVLQNWDVMKKNKKTQEFWWQGLPSSVRGKIWRLAIGNELNVTPQLYEICLSRAQSRLNSPEVLESNCKGNDIDQESSMDVIQLDISRTFPNLCIFQEGGPYSDVLHSLLAAYVCYRPDVGYVQGMSYIAAILILNMEAVDAFICFANLLNQPLHLAAFSLNQQQMQAYFAAYNEVFNYNLPKLHGHFEAVGLTADLYLLDWIYTIFAKAMPLDIACRIWDIFLRDGYEFLFRTGLGILHLHQDILMTMDFLHGAQFLTRLPDDLSSEQLFKSIQSMTTSIGKQTFTQIVERYSNKDS